VFGIFRGAVHRKRWQERDANGPYHHVHDHEKDGLSQPPPMPWELANSTSGINDKTRTPAGHSPVLTYRVWRVHHHREHQNGADAAKERVDNRRDWCKWQKSGRWMNTRIATSRTASTAITEPATVNGTNHAILRGSTCRDSPITFFSQIAGSILQ
jgi:hypothetical protein